MGNLGSSVDEEFVWLHTISDHTSDPWKQMEDDGWFRGILGNLNVNKRNRGDGIPADR